MNIVKSITFFGECMVELRQTDEHLLNQSFAGDVYNAAVYLKRSYPKIQTAMSTCIGPDKFSKDMLETFASENIQTNLVLTDDRKTVGLYLVETDDSGERSFSYWRNDSAAKRTVEHFTPRYLKRLAEYDVFFFSGISLATISPELRETFWNTVAMLKDSGVKIAFDPNYRHRLWSSVEDTLTQYEIAFQMSDIALPGIEDMHTLYCINNINDTIEYLERYDIEELVIKDGPNSVVIKSDNDLITVPVKPVINVVDTTSAGDSFNGTYLGARMSGRSQEQAALEAARTAGIVIQYPGAIIPHNALK